MVKEKQSKNSLLQHPILEIKVENILLMNNPEMERMDLENFIPESLNSIINEELYVPHYQPIVNAINRKILGYEVLGRLYSITHDQFLSLGPYFHGKRFNLTQKVQVDRIIREKAIKYLKNSGNNTKLFFKLVKIYFFITG